jgi:hypothetical protein
MPMARAACPPVPPQGKSACQPVTTTRAPCPRRAPWSAGGRMLSARLMPPLLWRQISWQCLQATTTPAVFQLWVDLPAGVLPPMARPVYHPRRPLTSLLSPPEATIRVRYQLRGRSCASDGTGPARLMCPPQQFSTRWLCPRETRTRARCQLMASFCAGAPMSSAEPPSLSLCPPSSRCPFLSDTILPAVYRLTAVFCAGASTRLAKQTCQRRRPLTRSLFQQDAPSPALCRRSAP